MYSFWSVLLIFFVFLFFLKGVWNIYQKEKESAILDTESKQKLSALADEQSQLDSQIQRLNTNQGVEEELRQKFGVVKPGEELIVVEPEYSLTSTTTENSWYVNFLQKMKQIF